MPERMRHLRDAVREVQKSADKQIAAMDVRLGSTSKLRASCAETDPGPVDGQVELARELGRKDGYAEVMLEVAA